MLLIFLLGEICMSDKEIDNILKEIKENKDKLIEPEDKKTQDSINEVEFNLTVDNKKNEPEQETVNDVVSEKSPKDEEVHFDLTEAPVDDETKEENNTSIDELSQGKDVYFAEYAEEEPEETDDNGKKKKIIISVVAVIVVIAIALGVYFGVFYNKSSEEETTSSTVSTTETTTAPVKKVVNPLTGEDGYDENALTQRPVAVVVENEYSTASVKPQWGISQADIVLEGESEFSTRMLMFWADYNQVPEQVGPTRSARPPFIRFSQLFNAVFIHAGLSHTAGGYVGADTVFENENIDHINLLSLSESGDYFGRDYSRTKTVEHTGYLNGKNVAKLLAEKKIDTTLNQDKFTSLTFNENAQKLSNTVATKVNFKWSNRCPKTATYVYDETDNKYTTSDFDSQFGKSDVAFENLIFLLDNTQYVVKENYKGSGSSETYCNYDLSGGKGLVCSEGTAVEITWGVTDGKLWMRDAQGNDVSLNAGKSYIGYGSSNNGGSFTLGDSSTSGTN